MVLNVKKLQAAGVSVRIFERNGKGMTTQLDNLRDPFIEVFFEHGRALPPEVVEVIRDMVPTEYGDPVIDGLHNRIHAIQIMEAIERTGK